jgi:hypothetical protein
MKPVIQTILFLFITMIPVSGQDDFKVIKVNGTILLRDKGVSLETGTVFSEKEELLFRTDDATAAVINAQRGRMVITSKNHDLSSANSNYLPSMYNISSRGLSGALNSDLGSRFSGRYVVLDREAVNVDIQSYPMDNDHFFFLRYMYKGEEINKKLTFDKNTFYIDKAALFTVDGKPIPSADNTRIKLYYRKGNESVFISEFDLIFPDMNQLTRETEVILLTIKDKTPNEKKAEVGSYINEFYGKVPLDALSAWLETRFGIK